MIQSTENINSVVFHISAAMEQQSSVLDENNQSVSEVYNSSIEVEKAVSNSVSSIHSLHEQAIEVFYRLME